MILDMADFNIRMILLSPNYDILYCNTMFGTLEIFGREKLDLEGVYKPKQVNIKSFIRAVKLVEQGFLA